MTGRPARPPRQPLSRRRTGALAAGLLLTIAALLPPVSGMAEYRLSLHMALEMGLLAIAIPLVAYGAAPLLARCAVANLHPVAGIIALNVAVFTAQLPPVVDSGARSGVTRELMLAGFVLAALVFWCPIVGQSRLSSIGKIGVLMVASVPPTIPGITMALSHHLFYQAFRSLDDQQVAGLLLFGTAKLALVGGTFVVLWRLLTPDSDADDRDDRDRPVDDVPPILPDWLRRLDDELPAEASRPRVPATTGR